MNICFKSLLIADVASKACKKVNFADGDNLITSEKNSVGKSVLMKSLYHSLGADSDFDDIFRKNEILYELIYSANNHNYTNIRYKNAFCIFKNNELVSFVKPGNRTDLSHFYFNEFGMSVYLKNRNKSSELAPPAYMFVPYYLDQDRSWKEDQEPFSRQTMSQYEPINKNELYLYHLGLLKKDYGELKSQLDTIKDKLANKSNELTALDDSYSNIKKTIDAEEVITNSEELENLYRVNSKIMQELIEKQKHILDEIFKLDQKRVELLIKIRNNSLIIEKINKNKNPNSMVITCPNCNSQFDVTLQNDIGKIYSVVLLENENKSLELEQKQYLDEISSLKKIVEDLASEINNINNKSKQSRSDYEKYVGRIALSSLLDQQLSKIGELHQEITILNDEISNKEKELKELKERTNKAKNDFVSYYCDYLNLLDVTLFNPNSIKAFYKSKLSGSQYVRSTLAFFFAFLKVKQSYNTESFNWPLVIDSPREGEQDDANSMSILNFVLNENNQNLQRIVASVDAKKYIKPEILTNVNIIELSNNVGSVMSKEIFIENENHINECLAFFKR